MASGPISLLITHVDIEGQFLVVWGHLDQNALSHMNQMIKNYSAHFDNGYGVVTSPDQLQEGVLCVGKYNSTYNRVKVLSVHSNEVKVFLVDYGYAALLNLSNIHLLTLPKESNFLSVKSLCTKYVISNILMVSGKEDEALNWIRPFLNGEETKMILKDPNINAVELHFQASGKQYNVAQALSHKKFATTIATHPEQFLQMSTQPLKLPIPNLNPSLLSQPPPSAHNQGQLLGQAQHNPMNPAVAMWDASIAPFVMQGAIRPQPVQVPVPQISNMRQSSNVKPAAEPLLEGRVYEVVTTHVDEEDMTIGVHKKDESSSTLLHVISQINALPAISYDNVLEPGAYVLARQQTGAPRLRAVVFRLKDKVPGTDEDHVEVYFVDFGHKALVPVSEIYTIPEEFVSLKPFAHRCHLANLDLVGPWNKEVITELKALVMDKVLNMKVLPTASKTKRMVALYTQDNQNIIDLLIQQLKPLMFESVHIPKGQSVEVIVSFAISPSRFFVQLVSNQNALETLMDQVQDHVVSVLAAGTPTFPFSDDQLMSGNLACLAKFAEDERWYRAIIMDFEPPGNITVRYVDYGNESEVTKADVLTIPRHLMKVRTQSVECSLAGHSSRRESEIEETQFAALLEARDYTFLMSIKMQLLGSVLLVELWELKTKSSVRQILQAMIAQAQKAQKAPTPVNSSPESIASESHTVTSPSESAQPRSNFQRQSSRDESESNKPNRPKPCSDSNADNWRSRSDSSRSNGERSERFGDKGAREGRFLDRVDSRSERPGFGDKPRWEDSRRSGDDSRPPRKPRYGDDNEKSNEWGGNAPWDRENTFRSGNRGSREERGPTGFKKREDFSRDSWGGGQSFDSTKTREPPKKPQLLDGYPGGSQVPLLSSLGPVDTPRLVSVTHYESPLSFFVQLQDAHAEFLSFMEGLQTDYIKRKPVDSSQLQVGQHVMAQFSQDRCLYRAKVLQTSPEIKVNFFDYGNESSVPSHRVWNLANEHCSLPMQSIHCKLSNVVIGEAVNPLDCVPFFSDDHYEMLIKSYDGASQAEVDLITKGTGVKVSTRLVEAGQASLLSTQVTVSVEDPVHLPLLLNQTLAIHVSYVESTRKFFVHLEPDKPDLIAAKIVELLAKPEELFSLTDEEISEGKFVLATPDSEAWYRARVLFTPAEGTSHYSVKFIDIGDEAEVTLENILDIPEDLCDWSPQAFECYLSSSSEQTLDEPLETEFAETWTDVNATITVTHVSDKRLSVILYSEAGELQEKFHPTLPDNIKAASTVSPLCPYPVLRQGEKVFISHASENALFLQKVSNESHQATFASDIESFYSTTELPVLEKPAVGDIVAARSVEFETWYRTRVDAIQPDGQICVQYVDYGNSETIPASNMRALDVTHYYPPAYCLQVMLPGTFVKDSYKIFADMSDTFDVVYARGDNRQNWIVNLIGAEGSLMEKHWLTGQLVTSPDHPFQDEKSLVQRCVDWGLVPVTVMSFESPGHLAISLQADETLQNKLQAQLQDLANNTMPISGDCTELCLGKFSEDDQWYRAQVLDADFKALFVDYGNKDIVPEIRKLNYELRNRPALSVECSLPLIPVQGNEWSQEAVDRLDTLVTDKTPSGRLLDNESVPSIELIVDAKSVADILVEENLALRKSYKVFISHVVSAQEVYIQYATNALLDEVFTLMDSIESLSAPLDTETMKEGDLVAAKYLVDNAWYRARIEKIILAEEEPAVTAEVVFIDFGNRAITAEFRRLPTRFIRIPPLAKACSLVLPIDESWPETATEKLTELSQEGAVEFDLKWLGENKVELSDAQGKNLMAILLEAPPLKTYVLSHINSAADFYLQEENDNNLAVIGAAMDSYDAEPPSEGTPSKGDLVAAKFIDDGVWYRARVINTDPALEVLFVDYGNTSVATEWKSLSAALQSYKPCAIHCTLAKDNAPCAPPSQAATDKFIELSADYKTVYTADFLTPSSDSDLQVACLYIGEDCVADLLVTVEGAAKAVQDEGKESGAKDSNRERIRITWTNSVQDFFVQKVNDDALQARIAEALNNLDEASDPIEAQVGDFVAAQYGEDQQWYRSRLLENQDSSVTVLFVDYGNTSSVSKLRQLPPTISVDKIPPVVRKCQLGHVHESTQANDLLSQWEIERDDLTMEVLEEKEGVAVVELMSGEECLSRLIAALTEEEVAEESAETESQLEEEISESSMTETALSETSLPLEGLDEKLKELELKSSPSKLVESENDVESTIFYPASEMILESVSKESSPSRQSLKEKVRSPQKVHVITHVNSPSDFYLMIDAEASITIGNILTKAEEFEPVHSVILGGTYAAFNEREDSWHRAKLVELIDCKDDEHDTYLVKYIDFGNTDVVDKNMLRELPDNVRDMPSVVRNCELEVDENFVDWSEAVERKLSDLVVSGQFYVEKMIEDKPNWPARVVLKTTDGVNVNELLLHIQQESKQDAAHIKEEEDEYRVNDPLNDTIISDVPSKSLAGQRVVVSHYSSAEDFYVQVVKDKNILDSVNSLLGALKDLSISEIVEGKMFAGRTQEGWYRVAVVWEKAEQEERLVKRVDYGDKMVCTQYKALTEDLNHISPLAHHCQVDGNGADVAKWKANGTELIVTDTEDTQPLTVVLKEADEKALNDAVAGEEVTTSLETSSTSLLDKTNGFDISMD